MLRSLSGRSKSVTLDTIKVHWLHDSGHSNAGLDRYGHSACLVKSGTGGMFLPFSGPDPDIYFSSHSFVYVFVFD